MFENDGKLMHILVRVADAMILHAVWLIFCIPIVTIGPATTAACLTAQKLVRDEGTSVPSIFWEAFRKYFVISLQASAVLVLWGSMLGIDICLILFVIAMPDIMRAIVLGLLLFIGICFWMEMVYIWNCIPHFAWSWRAIFQNVLIFAAANVKDSVQILVEDIALIAVFIVSYAFFPQIVILFYIFGLPLFFFIHAAVFRNILECREK